jgi:hypothetical protein
MEKIEKEVTIFIILLLVGCFLPLHPIRGLIQYKLQELAQILPKKFSFDDFFPPFCHSLHR